MRACRCCRVPAQCCAYHTSSAARRPWNPAPVQRENENEKAETREKVEEDRKPQIEAAIVRIMKVRAGCWSRTGCVQIMAAAGRGAWPAAGLLQLGAGH